MHKLEKHCTLLVVNYGLMMAMCYEKLILVLDLLLVLVLLVLPVT